MKRKIFSILIALVLVLSFGLVTAGAVTPPHDRATAILAAADNITGIDFTLETGGAVSGVVVSDSGDPIPGAWIRAAYYKWPGTTVGSTGSGADGSYRLEGLPLGELIFVASAPGYVLQFYNGRDFSSQRDKVMVVSGEITGIDFTLSYGSGSMSGHVYEADGVSPVNQANIRMYYFDGTEWIFAWATGSKSDGSYSFRRLLPGDYKVMARTVGHVAEWYPEKTFLADADNVSIAVGEDTPNIDFTLSYGDGSMSGHVYEADGVSPVKAYIRMYYFDGTEWIFAYCYMSRFNGSYSFQNLLPGDYKVMARTVGHVAEWYLQKTSLAEADNVTIAVGEDTPNIDFTLSQLYETPPGEAVQINDPYNGVTIEFDSVITGGDTSIVVTDEEPAPSSGFAFLDRYYDISTTASYSGNVTITITYDATGMTLEEEQALRLYHWNGSIWEDVTVLPVDTENDLIRGVVTSFSWLSVGIPPEVSWLPPLSTQEIFAAQDGSTVPIKFQLTDASGNLVSEANVVVTVYNSDGSVFEVLGLAVYEPDIPGYKINAQTREWPLGEYIIQLSVDQDAKYGLSLVEKGQAKGKGK